MTSGGANATSEIQGGIGTVLAEGRLYVVLFTGMVLTFTVFIVWNGLEQDDSWIPRLLTGLEHMSWAIVTSTGLTTTIILLWERIAMVLARKMLLRNREAALLEGRQEGRQQGEQEGRQQGEQEGRQQGRQEGRQQGRREGRQEGRREAAMEILTWLEAQGGLEESAHAVQAWLDRQKAATDAGREFDEPIPFADAKPQG